MGIGSLAVGITYVVCGIAFLVQHGWLVGALSVVVGLPIIAFGVLILRARPG